ncbi:hypothetical protein [Yersinia enterocolitica]|uniref:hypothetical protein n=1 Tax=Yersinia enterocolitica TaxID=630 RepID=UPI003F437646
MSTPENDLNSAKVSEGQIETIEVPIYPQTTFQKILVPMFLVASPFLKDTRYIAANDCSQRFSNLVTSSKGKVRLRGTGNDFIFKGKYIDEIRPCLREPKSQQHVVFSAIKSIDVALRLWTKKPLPEEPKPELFTAIRIGGSYQCLVFLDVSFEDAVQKLSEAKRRSNQVHRWKFS